MRINYYKNTILYIPSKIVAYNSNYKNIKLRLMREITHEDKDKLYNTHDINELKIQLADNLNIIDSYIYKLTINKEDKDTYHFNRNNKINLFSTYSKTLSSCWFIGNL